MTDLTQAIKELRLQTPTDEPWVDDDFFDRPALAAELPTILNAVLSGDLIPRADADLAVALMVIRAGEAVAETEIGFHDGLSGDWHPIAGPSILSAACSAVRALVPASALAELRALRDERDHLSEELGITEGMLVSERAELATLRAQVERLTGALTIAANRLHRCSVDYDTGTREFIEVGGWADEARAALTEGAAP